MSRYEILAIAILTASTAAATEDVRSRTHHAGFQLGVLWPSTDRLELGDGGVTIDGAAFLGILSYRYSVSPMVDLDLELRHWIGRWRSTGSRSTKVAAGFVGPGIRVHLAQTARVAPYLQFNIYWVQQQVTLSKTRVADGWGWGLSGGVDVTVNRRISIPIEATYVRSSGNVIDDLSGFGLSSGLDFHF